MQPVFCSLVALAMICLLPTDSLKVVRTIAEQPNGKKSTAKDIAEEWEPKGKATHEWHKVGVGPNDSPKLYVMSFSTSSSTFEEVWNYYAEKCGCDKKYAEKQLYIISEETKRGTFSLVERLEKDKRSESVFAFRGDRYTVFVTLRQGNDSKSVVGTLVVSLH